MTEHEEILRAVKDVSKQVEYLTDLVINSVVKRQPSQNEGEMKVDKVEVKEPSALELDAQIAFDDFTKFYLPALYDHGYLIAKVIKAAEQSNTEEVELPGRSLASLVDNTFRVWKRFKPNAPITCLSSLSTLMSGFLTSWAGNFPIEDIIPAGTIQYVEVFYSTETYDLSFARQVYKDLVALRTQIIHSSVFLS